jgi:hypothetical protein
MWRCGAGGARSPVASTLAALPPAPPAGTRRIACGRIGAQHAGEAPGLGQDALGQTARRHRHMHRVIATEHRTQLRGPEHRDDRNAMAPDQPRPLRGASIRRLDQQGGAAVLQPFARLLETHHGLPRTPCEAHLVPDAPPESVEDRFAKLGDGVNRAARSLHEGAASQGAF